MFAAVAVFALLSDPHHLPRVVTVGARRNVGKSFFERHGFTVILGTFVSGAPPQ
jgi:hypothetical protein